MTIYWKTKGNTWHKRSSLSHIIDCGSTSPAAVQINWAPAPSVYPRRTTEVQLSLSPAFIACWDRSDLLLLVRHCTASEPLRTERTNCWAPQTSLVSWWVKAKWVRRSAAPKSCIGRHTEGYTLCEWSRQWRRNSLCVSHCLGDSVPLCPCAVLAIQPTPAMRSPDHWTCHDSSGSLNWQFWVIRVLWVSAQPKRLR